MFSWIFKAVDQVLPTWGKACLAPRVHRAQPLIM